MTIWRYTAVALPGPGGNSLAGSPVRRRGELAGDSAAAVRGSLRRAGLQVIELRAVKRRRGAPTGDPKSPDNSAPRDATSRASSSARGGFTALRAGLRGLATGSAVGAAGTMHRWLRVRRLSQRTELYDGLATMLDSGLPVLEAIDALAAAPQRRRSSLRAMLMDLRESMRDGLPLSRAMDHHPAWFDAVEIAMVEAGQHASALPDVLRSLADRHEQVGDLAQRLVSALTYPCIIAMAGLAVVIFLSLKTLPELTAILHDAGVPTPTLTSAVMSFGQGLLHSGPLVLGGVVVLVIAGLAMRRVLGRAAALPAWCERLRARLVPRVARRMALARLSLQLAQLLRCGVPAVEALRVVAPTMSGLSGRAFRARILAAADRAERGDDLSESLDDNTLFDPEFRRLLEIGLRSGELDVLLERLGSRYVRQARRLIERLAAVTEPVVIVVLATLIGIVVLAAIGPLVRLQEILR